MKKFLKVIILLIFVQFMIIPYTKAITPISNIQYEGIDVSDWQGYINYEEVKKSGVKVVYIKASQGNNIKDPYFDINYENAKNKGLKVGFYHFLTATTTKEAEKQAQYFTNVISGKTPDCKLVMDYEIFEENTVSQIQEISQVFIETVKRLTNKEVIIYSDLYNSKTIFSKEKREGDNGYESRNTGRLRWGNIMAFTGWSYVFNNQLFGNVNAAFTHYSSTLKGDYYQGTEANYVSQESSTRNRIDDLSIRANFDFRPNASHQLHFGTHYIYHRFHPVDEKSHFSNGMTTQTRQNNDTALPAHELGIYMEEDWKMNKRIRLNAGVHLGLYTIDGKTYTSLEPRFSSRFLINPQLSLKASYTRMSQYVHQVNESYINLPTDTWIPVSRKLKPMQSDQLAVGAYYTTGNKIYSFSIEGYYKWMKHLMDYKDNYQFLPPSTSWEDKLTQGKGRSYGVELIARKEKGKITGWAGYTLSWNDRQFTEINKGKRFPAKFDNRHKFNIIANWKIKPKLELTGSWTYATGNRLTVSFENYQAVSPQHPFPGGSLVPPYIDPGGLDYYTERNNFQLPAYHRLDLGINIYRPKKKNRMGIWNISIYNVYSYMAPVSIRKGWWYNNDCFYTLGIVPIIPSVSYTYKF